MSRNDVAGKNTSKFFKPGQDGVNIQPGPYTAVVKGVTDPTRKGRLQVYIPMFGGDAEDPVNWHTVSYATPFGGHTRSPGEFGKKNKSNSFTYTEQTYGFWAVPPDIGNLVLVVFADHSTDQGYWIACIYDSLMQNMVPNIPGSGDGLSIGTVEGSQNRRAIDSRGLEANLPLSEHNRYDPELILQSFSSAVKRPLHELAAQVYINQGLDKDPIRGPSRGSSQRESPSAIFGISTPGRPIADLKDDQIFINSNGKEKSQLSAAPIYGRKGGHIFYMDDGDITGSGQQIRMRTAGGHQILMDDTTGTLSIHNSQGSVWLEMAKSGQIHIFSQAGLNFRSVGDINIHSDKNMKFSAGEEIRMHGTKGIRMEGAKTDISAEQLKLYSSGRTDMKADQLNMDLAGSMSIKGGDTFILQTPGKVYINAEGAPARPVPVKAPKGLTTYTHGDTVFNGAGGYWQIRANMVKNSIVNILPTHEPWDRTSGVVEKNSSNDAVESSVSVNTMPITNPEDRTDTESLAVRYPPGTKLSDGKTPINGVVYSAGFVIPNGPGWQNAESYTGSYATISDAKLKELTARYQYLADSAAGFGSLKGQDLATFMAVLSSTESKNYTAINQYGYAGAWQFGAAALETAGYIKTGTSSGNDSMYPIGMNGGTGTAVWTGKNGVYSLQDFIASQSAQDQALLSLTQANYKTLIQYGAITADSPPEAIAAALNMAHGLGAGGTAAILTGNNNVIGGRTPRTADGNGYSYQMRYWKIMDAFNRTRPQ
jgi:hypothetical protein